jgi:hypothetical protein
VVVVDVGELFSSLPLQAESMAVTGGKGQDGEGEEQNKREDALAPDSPMPRPARREGSVPRRGRRGWQGKRRALRALEESSTVGGAEAVGSFSALHPTGTAGLQEERESALGEKRGTTLELTSH